LDVRAKEINEEMKLAAVYAIAGLIADENLHHDYVIPDPFDSRVVAHVTAGRGQLPLLLVRRAVPKSVDSVNTLLSLSDRGFLLY
jgi:hypothetical protein